MTGRLLKIGVPAALLALVVTAFATNSPDELAQKLRARSRPSLPIESRFNVPEADGPRDLATVNPETRMQPRSVSILDDTPQGKTGLRVQSATSSSGPIVAPIVICAAGTSYDYQHNDDGQHQIATLGGSGNLTHFAYTFWDVIPDSIDQIDRFVNYQGYSLATGLSLGDCGSSISGAGGDPLKARAGFCSIDVSTGDLARPAFHQRAEPEQTTPPGNYSSWVLDQGIPGFGLFQDNQMVGSMDREAIWPKIDIDQGGGAGGIDIFHVTGHPTGDGTGPADAMYYWRRLGVSGAWEGPVIVDEDDGVTLNGHISADPSSDRVALIYNRDDQAGGVGNLDVVYIESPDNGASWITWGLANPGGIYGDANPADRNYITNYAAADGPQAWLESHGEYDNSGNLHIVYVEQVGANVTSDCRVRHWDATSGNNRIVAQAIAFENVGGDGGRDLWLSTAQIGFGDGSTTCTDGPPPGNNLDYVYVTYEQYGGPTLVEGNDVSDPENQQNLEIYLAVSNDGGNTWSPSVNLSQTKTPGCDGTVGKECASERDPSIAKIVNDTIHIFYILDIDAGDAVFGNGTWTFNPVHYLRIPGGTDVKPVCPTIAPNFAAFLSVAIPGCEYNAPLAGPAVNETLTIQNLGNAALNGSVSVQGGSGWLQLTTGAYAINAGDPDVVRAVTMDPTDPSVTGEGLYQDAIAITHNDTTKTSPHVINVDFFVFNSFACPEFVVLNTGWLWLEVGNTSQYANSNDDRGGLARLDPVVGDTSWSIFDASLVIARPLTFNPDTLVYRNIFGEGNGQPGFRALSALAIDTSAYGTNAGAATATCATTTVDSTIGIDIEYVFPQNADSCEFVLIKYKLYNYDGSALDNLVIGNAVDFDVMPGADQGSVQSGSQNTGNLLAAWNCIYQQGVDTTGHVIAGDNTATRFKGGITAIQTAPAPRAWNAPNDPWLFDSPGGGFSDGYLYNNLTGTGFELFPNTDVASPEQDRHTGIAFEQNVNLTPGAVKFYCVGLVSSVAGPNDATDLTNTLRKAWKYCFGWTMVEESPIVSADNTPDSWAYYATGSHEEGIGGGCSGCIVSKVSGAPELTISPSADPCSGTIDFSGGTKCGAPYVATFRVTDLCGTYQDDIVVSVDLSTTCSCSCPFQGDFDANNQIDAVDLGGEIDAIFFGGTDPQDGGCPTTRGDFNNDGFTDAVDLGGEIDHIFFGGAAPADPCAP